MKTANGKLLSLLWIVILIVAKKAVSLLYSVFCPAEFAKDSEKLQQVSSLKFSVTRIRSKDLPNVSQESLLRRYCCMFFTLLTQLVFILFRRYVFSTELISNISLSCLGVYFVTLCSLLKQWVNWEKNRRKSFPLVRSFPYYPDTEHFNYHTALARHCPTGWNIFLLSLLLLQYLCMQQSFFFL